MVLQWDELEIMCRIVLRCVLQCVAVYCNVLQWVELEIVCCSVAQRVAVSYSMLQCDATCCSGSNSRLCVSVCCIDLHCVAACIVLQRVAVWCSVF